MSDRVSDPGYSKSASGDLGEEREVGLNLAFGGKAVAGMATGGFTELLPQRGGADEFIEGGDEIGLITVFDEVAG